MPRLFRVVELAYDQIRPTKMQCPECSEQLKPGVKYCSKCGANIDDPGDATGGVIPYKNPPALIAYYLGLFSLFPLLGFFLAVPAFILGIIGLKKRAENPAIKGSVHAAIGVGCGGVMAIVWGLAIISMIIALIAEA